MRAFIPSREFAFIFAALMSTIPDITIIGGGIIGLLTARELHNAGATVSVFEKSQIGQESSWAGGGILLPIYPWRQADAITRLVLQSLSLYPELAKQLLADTQLDPEWNPCGLLITKNPDLEAAVDWCKNNHIAYQEAGSEFFNGINTQAEHPLWLPDIAQARNPRLLKSLKQDLVNKGVPLTEYAELKAVSLHHRRVTAINTSAGEFPINRLVMTTGAWTGQLFEQLFASLPGNIPRIAPVKGQMLLFDAEPETLGHMVLDGDHYLIPRLDGKILAGSTVEHSGFNKATTLETRDQLRDFALNLLPTLKNFPQSQHWAGLRPGTEHGIPYIDIHPEISNLYINAGHFRNGLVMGPASAQLMVDLILDRPTAVAPEPYQLSRPH